MRPRTQSILPTRTRTRTLTLTLTLAAMEAFTIQELREERAIIRIHTTEDEGGQPVQRTYPMHLKRAEDGTWWIYDY